MEGCGAEHEINSPKSQPQFSYIMMGHYQFYVKLSTNTLNLLHNSYHRRKNQGCWGCFSTPTFCQQYLRLLIASHLDNVYFFRHHSYPYSIILVLSKYGEAA